MLQHESVDRLGKICPKPNQIRRYWVKIDFLGVPVAGVVQHMIAGSESKSTHMGVSINGGSAK